jgi:hypothetical protein
MRSRTMENIARLVDVGIGEGERAKGEVSSGLLLWPSDIDQMFCNFPCEVAH